MFCELLPKLVHYARLCPPASEPPSRAQSDSTSYSELSEPVSSAAGATERIEPKEAPIQRARAVQRAQSAELPTDPVRTATAAVAPAAVPATATTTATATATATAPCLRRHPCF